MSNAGYFKYLLPAAMATVFGTFSVWSQQPDNKNPNDDVRGKPIKAKTEPNNVFKNWVEREVPYIITDAEKKAYDKLTNNQERENFIEAFWRRRNPNPDSEVNEFREQYYERIAYANEHFASGKPGWKTDRGRIYITFGKPDSVDAHPTGGSYDWPSYEGGGSTTTYAFETWSYRHLDNVGEGVEIEFVDPSGSGEYRIARDANEKDALLHIPNAGRTTNEELGLSSKANRISGIGNNSFQREQDSFFSRQQIQQALFRPPAVKFGDLLPTANSGVVGDNPLQFDLRIDYFRQADDRVITAFTVQTSNRELKFEHVGGLEQASMNILGLITAVSAKRSGIFEDSVTTNATSAELAETRDRKSVYQKAIALTPGIYKVDVVVRDVVTGKKGIKSLSFVVPKYDENKLSTSSLILTSKLRSTDERDSTQMFVVGNTKVVPNLSGEYKTGQEVGVYLQVYNVGIDPTTLRPAADVEYILTSGGKEILRLAEDWSGLSDSGQRLTLARILPTSLMPAGDYEIKVQVKDRVGGQVIENWGKFTITK